MVHKKCSGGVREIGHRIGDDWRYSRAVISVEKVISAEPMGAQWQSSVYIAIIFMKITSIVSSSHSNLNSTT